MGKKVLVIGGSYFLGRVFAMLASREAGFDLTFINRGRYSMKHLPNTTEYSMDRHDAAALASIPTEEFDAVVDFCAYAPGDISTVVQNLRCSFKRYIFISTADVYDRGCGAAKDESAPLVSVQSAGQVGEYVYNKMLLELECSRECKKLGVHCTMLRPAFVYGPYNYAPRESFYIKKICLGEAVPHPIDSDSEFQFVYVKDAANAIIACINRESDLDEAYNLAAPEIITYEKYLEVLKKVSDIPFTVRNVTVQQVLQENIAVPFPLVPEENELFDGSKAARVLGIEYMPFDSAMVNTFNAFKGVYRNN